MKSEKEALAEDLDALARIISVASRIGTGAEYEASKGNFVALCDLGLASKIFLAFLAAKLRSEITCEEVAEARAVADRLHNKFDVVKGDHDE